MVAKIVAEQPATPPWKGGSPATAGVARAAAGSLPRVRVGRGGGGVGKVRGARGEEDLASAADEARERVGRHEGITAPGESGAALSRNRSIGQPGQPPGRVPRVRPVPTLPPAAARSPPAPRRQERGSPCCHCRRSQLLSVLGPPGKERKRLCPTTRVRRSRRTLEEALKMPAAVGEVILRRVELRDARLHESPHRLAHVGHQAHQPEPAQVPWPRLAEIRPQQRPLLLLVQPVVSPPGSQVEEPVAQPAVLQSMMRIAVPSSMKFAAAGRCDTDKADRPYPSPPPCGPAARAPGRVPRAAARFVLSQLVVVAHHVER